VDPWGTRQTFFGTPSMAPNPARAPNPVWPWILGGVVALGGVGAIMACQPRDLLSEEGTIGGFAAKRQIRFNGCRADPDERYTTTVTINGERFKRGYSSWIEAQALRVQDVFSDFSERLANPSSPPTQGQMRARAQATIRHLERSSYDAGWTDGARGMYRPRGDVRLYNQGWQLGKANWTTLR
jgi:hypothetical protein